MLLELRIFTEEAVYILLELAFKIVEYVIIAFVRGCVPLSDEFFDKPLLGGERCVMG